MTIRNLMDWFAGGSSGYMTLVHCMNHDLPWIAATVTLDLVIASGYVVIALHWKRSEALLGPSAAKRALGNMKNIFLFCGLCGYLFIPIKMFWPAWRLYDAFLLVLGYYTWRYALSTRSLKVVYQELVRTAKLAQDVEVYRAEASRKSHFLNAVSHDLKTPLNGMLLQAELAELTLDANDIEGLRDALATIKRCARTTDDILNRFLEIGRLDWSQEPSQYSAVDLQELLDHVVSAARVRAEAKGLTIQAGSATSSVIETDRTKLERILFNLVDNAIKFTQVGSVQLAAESGGSRIRIHVDDTGDGISDDCHELIFDEFVQLNNRERDSRKGFGLGLSIARRLARQMGGELEVTSEAGKGSRFTVILPVREPVANG